MGFGRSRTTLDAGVVRRLELDQVTKEELLQQLESGADADESYRAKGPAVVEVIATQLKNPEALAALGRERAGIATDSPTRPEIVTLARLPLHDFSALGRVDVIRVGRLPTQDIQLVEPLVSREHGLVLFAEGAVLYCDYGTLGRKIPGKHAGSTNGTRMAAGQVIKDTLIRWPHGTPLFFGKAHPPLATFTLEYHDIGS